MVSALTTPIHCGIKRRTARKPEPENRAPDPQEAAKAISEASRAAEARRAATAEALKYLNRPTVEFVTGMPAHFLRGRG